MAAIIKFGWRLRGGCCMAGAPVPAGRRTPRLLSRLTGNAYLMLFLTTLLWAGNALASPAAVGHLSPMVLVLLRWSIVVVVLAVIARDAIVADWPVLKHHLPFLFVMGAFGYTGFNTLFYVAGHHT
ncbi:MAG: hypothetical protein ACRC7G_18115, partial [Beijerinckiaceae bacterium]